MIKTTEQTKALNKALLRAQKSIQVVERDSANPHFRSRYASLTAVLQAVKEPLNEAGLLLTQSAAAAEAGSGLIVTTRITHAETSEWIETSIPIPLEQPTAQKVGSATTYGRRYGLDALLVLATADDDGQQASQQPARTNGTRRGANTTSQPKSAYQARKDGDWESLLAEMREQSTPDILKAWGLANRDRIEQLPNGWQEKFREAYSDQLVELRASFAEVAE